MAEQCNVKYQIVVLQGVNLHSENCECPRDAVRDGRCHFHLDDPDKPLEPLLAEIRRQSQSDSCKDIDLSHFIFPRDSFQYPVTINKPVFIEHCKFYGDASFRGHRFPGYTSFHSTEFFGEADFGDDNDPYHKQLHFLDRAIFNNVKFHKKAFFRSCVFKDRPEFNGTTFYDIAVFAWAVIAFDATNWWLEFRLCEFHGDADLEFRVTGKIAGIRFAYCNLAGLKIDSLPKEDVRIEFENIKAWAESRRWYQWRRKRIRDEQSYPSNPVKVIDSYRYLEKYFFEHSDFNLARHFYLGQMIVTRNDSNYDWPSKAVNRIYQFVSNFGESILRPATCLVLSFLIFPMILLFMGMNVNRPDEQDVTEVRYSLDQVISGEQCSYLWNDYKSALGANFSLSTFDRKHELSPPSDSLQKGILVLETVFNIVLASLIVVASRRKFTPKRPQGG